MICEGSVGAGSDTDGGRDRQVAPLGLVAGTGREQSRGRRERGGTRAGQSGTGAGV